MKTPLIVDLDGTLISTDSLVESAILLVKANPLYCFLIVFWAIKGRARLKKEIASRTNLDVRSMPYNKHFLKWLKGESESGRQIYLATAAHISIATQVSEHLQLFVGVYASSEDCNLKGVDKLRVIREKCGEDFVYAGDSLADLPIWRAAQAAVLVGVSPDLALQVKNEVQIEKEFTAERISIKTWLRALRVRQWVKNTLLFVPLLTAFEFLDISKVFLIGSGFLAFSLVASGTYILNDIWDLDADRAHPRKCKRPFASGEIPIIHGIAIAGFLLIVAAGIAASLSHSFFLVLLTYFIMTSVYSIFLKEYVLVDILMLSFLYTLRIIAGATVIGVALSSWLLAFSMFLFLSLSLIKRCAELVAMAQEGESLVVSGRDYRVGDLAVLWPFGVGSSISAIVVFGLFISAPETQLRYASPDLLWAVALGIIYWQGRMWIITSRGLMHEDPIVYVTKDRISYLVLLSLIVLTVIAYFYTVPIF